MIRLTLILTAAVVAMSGASAVARPERDSLVAPSTAPLTRGESTRLLNGLATGDEIAPRLKKIRASIFALQSPFASKQSKKTSLRQGHAETVALDQALVRLRTGFDAVEQRIRSTGGRASVDVCHSAVKSLRSRFDAAMKDIEADLKSLDFDVQAASADYKTAQTAASNVQKKIDEAKNNITQNLQ
jgi:hypothetical protein